MIQDDEDAKFGNEKYLVKIIQNIRYESILIIYLKIICE